MRGNDNLQHEVGREGVHLTKAFDGRLYEYGWPSGGTSEPDVTCQYLFDEGAGNLVDEVATLTATVSGSLTRGVTATGAYVNLAPGISNAGTAYAYNTTSPVTPVLIGTDSFVIETWSSNSTDAGARRVQCGSWISGTGGFVLWSGDSGSDGSILVTLTADDATTNNFTFTRTGQLINDGNMHKIRVTGNRAGNLECFVDNVSLGPQSLAAFAGKTIPAPSIYLFKYSGGYNYKGALFEFRMTIGNYTNNSTP